jgi:lysophospholipase L1-like esterase
MYHCKGCFEEGAVDMRYGLLMAFLIAACSSGTPSMADVHDGADPAEQVPAEPEEPQDDGAGEAQEDPPVEPPGDGEEDAASDGAGEEEPPIPLPIDGFDDLKLYINIGDSLAAGYNAGGRNGSGGKGYARLVLENHPDYPAYAAHNLRALYPDVQFVDISHSGDTSSDALARVRGASLPAVDGDVLVSLTCGGNDFNDEITVMILRSATEAAAANLQGNYREIFDIIRSRYEDGAAGREVVFLVTNVHDPTGGTGAVPPGLSDGFCGLLSDPRVIPVRATAIANLEFFNSKIAEVVAELGGYLVDNHAVFFDHGMNAGSECWIDTDCVHPLDIGHHELRREEWFVLAGERW